MTILDAAQSGSQVRTLEAMRDKLAADMDVAEPAVVAQVSGRLESVLKRLAELRPEKQETIEDALAARRDARKRRAVAQSGS